MGEARGDVDVLTFGCRLNAHESDAIRAQALQQFTAFQNGVSCHSGMIDDGIELVGRRDGDLGVAVDVLALIGARRGRPVGQRLLGAGLAGRAAGVAGRPIPQCHNRLPHCERHIAEDSCR